MAAAVAFLKSLFAREPVAILDVVKYGVSLVSVYLLPVPPEVSAAVLVLAGFALTSLTRGQVSPKPIIGGASDR